MANSELHKFLNRNELPSSVAKKKRIRKFWTYHEKKTLLVTIKEIGHKDIHEIAQRISTKTEKQIAKYIRNCEKSALRKFKVKERLSVQEPFSNIHPWMSFINVHCNDRADVHDNLPAYILPILEKYGNSSNPNFNGIDFRSAYSALFNALTMQPFSDDLSHETFAMIYANAQQLFKEMTETFSESHKNILSRCAERHFTDSQTKELNEENQTMQLPEVNVLQLNSEELAELCQLKN